MCETEGAWLIYKTQTAVTARSGGYEAKYLAFILKAFPDRYSSWSHFDKSKIFYLVLDKYDAYQRWGAMNSELCDFLSPTAAADDQQITVLSGAASSISNNFGPYYSKDVMATLLVQLCRFCVRTCLDYRFPSAKLQD